MADVLGADVLGADVPVVAVLVGAVVAFVAGAAYYGVLGGALAAAHGDRAPEPRPPAVLVPVELGRCLVLAAVVGVVLTLAGVSTVVGGLGLGLLLWLGFPAVLWSGAVLHERTPLRLAALHAGDWLVKLALLGGLVGALR